MRNCTIPEEPTIAIGSFLQNVFFFENAMEYWQTCKIEKHISNDGMVLA